MARTPLTHSCAQCLWFRKSADVLHGGGGFCKAGRPFPDGLGFGVWPLVEANDFCGDYDSRRDAEAAMLEARPANGR